VAAKERKALFNEFCANAAAKRQVRAAAGVRQVLQELLQVTPLQFRLFREGKDMVEVEMEAAADAEARAQSLKGFVGEEPEEGEQAEDGLDKRAGGDSDAALAMLALDVDACNMPGGLITADFTAADVSNLLPDDPRWGQAAAALQEAMVAEVLGPHIKRRREADAAVHARFEKRMAAWLDGRAGGGNLGWEGIAAERPPLLALLPDRLARAMFEQYMERTRTQQVRNAAARTTRSALRRGPLRGVRAEAAGARSQRCGAPRKRPEAPASSGGERRSAQERGCEGCGRAGVPHAARRDGQGSVQGIVEGGAGARR
jgi:hypothetical protein